jgi:hypothetical protein
MERALLLTQEPTQECLPCEPTTPCKNLALRKTWSVKPQAAKQVRSRSHSCFTVWPVFELFISAPGTSVMAGQKELFSSAYFGFPAGPRDRVNSDKILDGSELPVLQSKQHGDQDRPLPQHAPNNVFTVFSWQYLTLRILSRKCELH